MRVNFCENCFQKIPVYIDLLLSFKAKVYLPDSILKAELLGVFELLAQQNSTIHQVRRMILTVNQGVKVSGNWLIKFPPLITRYVKWKPPAEESEHGFFRLSTQARKIAPFHQPVPGFINLLHFSWFNVFPHFWKPLVSSYSSIGSASLSLLHVTTKDMYRVFLQQMFTIVKNEKQHQNSSIRGSLNWIIFFQWNITQ